MQEYRMDMQGLRHAVLGKRQDAHFIVSTPAQGLSPAAGDGKCVLAKRWLVATAPQFLN